MQQVALENIVQIDVQAFWKLAEKWIVDLQEKFASFHTGQMHILNMQGIWCASQVPKLIDVLL